MLINLSHHIYQYDLADSTFTPLTNNLDKPASFLSVSKNKIAYGTHPRLFIRDLKDGTILEREFEVKTISGSIPFDAVLSKDGSKLAFHNAIGEIQLIDTRNFSAIGKNCRRF